MVKTVALPVRIRVGIAGVAAGRGHVWVNASPNLVDIAAPAATVRGVVGFGSPHRDAGLLGAAALAVGPNAVWVIGGRTIPSLSHSVARVALSTHRYLRPVRISRGFPMGLASGAGSFWISTSEGEVVRADAMTGHVQQTIPVTRSLDLVAYGGGSVWAADGLHSRLFRIDPGRDGVGQPVQVSGNLEGMVATEGGVWTLDREHGLVSHLDAGGGILDRISVGSEASAIVAGRRSVWVSGLDGVIRKIDGRPGQVVERTVVGAPLTGIAFDDLSGSLWVTVARAFGRSPT